MGAEMGRSKDDLMASWSAGEARLKSMGLCPWGKVAQNWRLELRTKEPERSGSWRVVCLASSPMCH